MIITHLSLGVALATILAAPALASGNLLTNGSFEQPGGIVRDQLTANYLPGWTYGSFNNSYDIYEDDSQDGLAAADGTHYVSFGHDGTNGGYVYQSFATVVGDTYHAGFAVAEQQGDDSTQQFTVCISPDGTSCSVQNVYGALQTTFVQHGFNFVANSTTTSIGIADTTPAGGGGGSNLALDNVSVTQGANGVPEPATWAMMLAGFGLAGAAIRRRTASLAA